MADYFDEMGWTPLGENEAPNSFLHMARFLRDAGMWELQRELLGEENKLPPPASRDAVENLEEIEFKDDTGK